MGGTLDPELAFFTILPCLICGISLIGALVIYGFNAKILESSRMQMLGSSQTSWEFVSLVQRQYFRTWLGRLHLAVVTGVVIFAISNALKTLVFTLGG